MAVYDDTVKAESSLVAYWRLNETSGTSAADSKGSYTGTHNSVTVGEAAAIVGDGGSAKYVRASSAYTQINDAAAFKGNNTLTMEAWVKFDTLPTTAETLFTVFGKVNSFYWTHRNNSGTHQFYVNPTYAAGSGPITVNWTPTTNTWYHAAVTFDSSSQKVKCYVNGAQQGTDQTHAFSGAAGDTSKPEISRFNSNYWFNGSIAEMAFYNAVLSADTIAAHYNAGRARYLPKTRPVSQAVTRSATR